MSELAKKVIADQIRKKAPEVKKWFLSKTEKHHPPFYCSVDLRDSGHKIAPVDSNLFPAGFNNICPADIRAASPIIRANIESLSQRLDFSMPKKILVLPEYNTKNKFYVENLIFLVGILKDAGFEVGVGWDPEDSQAEDKIELESDSGKKISAHKLQIRDQKIWCKDEPVDLVVVNNDFSRGFPTYLKDVQTPTRPSLSLGWHSRKKINHFDYYNQLADEFAQLIDIDPWMIKIQTEAVDGVSFGDGTGVDKVHQVTSDMLEKLNGTYKEKGIDQKPFVFVKNNSGTYGMGIMMVESADQLTEMNRRAKNKMSVGKNKMQIESVVVQEGVPTSIIVNDLAAEPVIYLAGCELIGGFIRSNTKKGANENLNSQGMVFKKLCMSDLPKLIDPQDPSENEPDLELAYGNIARLSAMASAMELCKHS